MLKQYVCENCGEIFEARSQDKRGKNVFCSRECQHQWRTGRTDTTKKKGVYKICPICGKRFYVYPSEINQKTCSRKCKVDLERQQGVHSGENCNFWTGGFEQYRGKNWYKQRELARKRDHNTCQICGKTVEEQGYNMIVHHLVPFRFFENDYKKANSLENLICLCHACHVKQESHHWQKVPEEYQYLLKGHSPCQKDNIGKRYSQEEIDFIKANYKKMEYEEIAQTLNRPKSSVADKILSLGLYKGHRTVLTAEQIRFIKENYSSKPQKFFDEKMPDVSYNTIKSYCNRHGIYKDNTEPSRMETGGRCRD
ncbi:HNH endonuclease [Negativibacillus massiliensis]|uniref:HNH endonuclease n=1 Tax=Negativibacillus massiliensis TaxID=1871035 RepID=UPI003AF4BCB4